MLFQKSFVAATFAGVALAKSGSSIEDSIPKCAQPCIAEAQKSVTCQLTDLTCLCANYQALSSNSAVITCFTTSCPDASALTGLVSALTSACTSSGSSASGSASGSMTTSYSSSASAHVSSGYSTTMTSASGIYSNSTASPTGGATGSGSGSSGPSATSQGSGGSSPSASTKPSSASRSEFGMASLAVALVVAMVSF